MSLSKPPRGELSDYVEYTSLMVNMSRRCNLDCRLCYVDKTVPFEELDDEILLGFIERYRSYVDEWFDANINVYLCGHGELFAHPRMAAFINRITATSVRNVCLLTNGTVDRLDQLERLDRIRFAVSLDMPKAFCDWNRGPGTFDKICAFVRHAVARGAQSVMVQSIMTRDTYREVLDQGADFALRALGADNLALIPLYSSDIRRRGMFYVGNYDQDTLCLSEEQLAEVSQHRHAAYVHNGGTMLPRYLTLYSTGRVFNCSDCAVDIGSHDEPIEALFAKLTASGHCGFCTVRAR